MTGDQHPLDSTQKLSGRINLNFAIKAAGLGAWEYDINTGIVIWDELCRSLYGITEGTHMAYEQFMQCVHPDDTNRMAEAIQRAGTPQSGGYYDIIYRVFGASDGIMRWVHCYGKAEFTDAGDISFFGGVLQDVTQQQLDRQQLEKRTQELAEKEVALRNAVELAELGTWTLDIAKGDTYLSPRQAEMFGLNTAFMPYEVALSIVHPDDRERVRAAFEQAIQPGSDGRYQAEYRIINASNGRQQIIRAKGETSLNAQGKPIRITGTAQDVTLEREQQESLEEQVQYRTEELAAANQALTTVNEALEEANQLLIRSNDNLQTFAYVASHDLQEPLRKIQQFGDLLKTRYTESTGDESDYLERMQLAAARMSVLIKDLLSFSRISSHRDTDSLVSLDSVVQQVLTTLELTIQEKGAQVNVDSLPTVTGDASQLNQLFQNLLSNALKFHRPETIPLIEIRTSLLASDQLPEHIKPSREATAYHRVDIADNGIGFDEKYLDRIFQVFQRLHSKNEFVGTGIGLAICEKVVANHGGFLTATSQLGQGATFTVYLPA